jgi:hypothetical protein
MIDGKGGRGWSTGKAGRRGSGEGLAEGGADEGSV